MALLTDSLTLEVDVIPLMSDSVGLVVDVFSNRLSDSVRVDVMLDTLLEDSVRVVVGVAGAAMEAALGEGVIKPTGQVTFS